MTTSYSSNGRTILIKTIFDKRNSHRDEDKLQVMDLESYYQLTVGIERVR